MTRIAIWADINN